LGFLGEISGVVMGRNCLILRALLRGVGEMWAFFDGNLLVKLWWITDRMLVFWMVVFRRQKKSLF
jgi:hypothetical protein